MQMKKMKEFRSVYAIPVVSIGKDTTNSLGKNIYAKKMTRIV
jgi:hypothetical protein